MALATHDFDLAGLRLSPGEGRRLTLMVAIEPLLLGSERYTAASISASSSTCDDDAQMDDASSAEGDASPDGEPAQVPVELSISRMSGGGYALRLRFSAAVRGPCMRCLRDACPRVEVQTREVDRPGGGDELDSPYVHEETLDLAGWARDAFALALPVKILCREDCAGLCPVCAADLSDAGPRHRHELAPDPRWAKLRELKLE
jgi:uncharacterized protein